MAALGYDRYGAQGGDWGAAVTTAHRRAATPSTASASTSTWPSPARPRRRGDLTDAEQAALAALDEHYREWDSGYSTQQSTRPQTLGYGLVDSPAGQCAWIVEKFWAWTDCDGHPENVAHPRRSCSTT